MIAPDPGTNPNNMEFRQQAVNNVLHYIKKIKEEMPFLINLSEEEKRKLAAMNEGRRPFAQKALEYAKGEPGPIPRNIDLDKMEVDTDTFLKLRKVQREWKKVDELLRDTIALKGSNSYKCACKIYQAYSMARDSDIHGIDSIYNDLFRHFERGERNNNNEIMPGELEEPNE